MPESKGLQFSLCLLDMNISLQRVTKKFGKLTALNDVSLDIDSGQLVAVLGPNGAGKTTLLRSLAGIVAPDRGCIMYDNEKFHRGRMDFRRRICFVPDASAAYPEMTPVQHIGMVLNLYDVETEGIEDQVTEAMKDLEILSYADVPMSVLSRGQFYKVVLTAAVVLDRDIWLLDEPFASGMDPNGIMAFKKYARSAAEAGRTVIYSTQIFDAAEGLCDRACVINKGKIEAYSTMKDLAQRVGRQDDVLAGIFQRLRENPD